MKTTILVTFLFLVHSYASAAVSPTSTFTGLGDLPGGAFGSFAWDVSADGSVVVGASTSTSDDNREAFRWTSAGGMVGLGSLGGNPPSGNGLVSRAADVSVDGSVVVGTSRSSLDNLEAFRWTSAGGMVGLGSLSTLIPLSTATGVSADGSVVVGQTRTEPNQNFGAFRWTDAGGMVGLGYLAGGGFTSRAWDVSADGSTIVGTSDSALSSREAFRWTNAGGMVGLGDLPGGNFESVAWNTSADGSVVVGFGVSAQGTEAFRWTSGSGMVGLGDLSGGIFNSLAWDVSAAGSVVVGQSITDSGPEAFLWDDVRGMRNLRDVLVNDHNLDLTGWTLTSARALSADGKTIVGTGINPSGNNEAWIATIPEPSSLVLLTLVGLVTFPFSNLSHPTQRLLF